MLPDDDRHGLLSSHLQIHFWNHGSSFVVCINFLNYRDFFGRFDRLFLFVLMKCPLF